MIIYPITFLFALFRYFPLFIREWTEHYLAKVLRTGSEDADKQQAKIVAYVLRAQGVCISDQGLQRLYSLLPNHISIDAKERTPAVLKEWNITTTVRELNVNNEPIDFTQPEASSETPLAPEDLYGLASPLLIRLNNGTAAAILTIAEDIALDKRSVIIYDSQGRVKLISFNRLADIWAGTLFDIDLSGALEEPAFTDKINREHWQHWVRPGSSLFVTLTLCAFVQFQFAHYSGIALAVYLGITATLFTGLGLSLVLAQHSIGGTHGVLARYCATSTHNSCQKILDNPRATFFGIGHADIGVAYFGGTLLLFFASLLSTNAQPYIYAINSTLIDLSFVALAYSVYSIYVQKKVIAQWCRLCLYIQAVVLTQVLLTVFFLSFSHHTPYQHFSFILTAMLLVAPGIIWYFLRGQLISKALQKEQQYQLEEIISSDNIIEKILANKQQRVNSENTFCFDDDEDLEGDVILQSNVENNNSQALRIVVGLSPSCVHCGGLLEELYQFAQTQHYAFECRIRLIVGEGDTKESMTDQTIAEHITAFISHTGEGQSVAIDALRRWYQQYHAITIDEWLSTVRNISEAESIDIGVLLADTSFWVSQKDIQRIPAMYVENIHMPFVSEAFSTVLLRKICTH